MPKLHLRGRESVTPLGYWRKLDSWAKAAAVVVAVIAVLGVAAKVLAGEFVTHREANDPATGFVRRGELGEAVKDIKQSIHDHDAQSVQRDERIDESLQIIQQAVTQKALNP